jgi:hypothetical protein
MLTRWCWIQKHLTVGRSCALGHLPLLIIVHKTRGGKGREAKGFFLWRGLVLRRHDRVTPASNAFDSVSSVFFFTSNYYYYFLNIFISF